MLANIALHGLEEEIKGKRIRSRENGRETELQRPQLIRYADDFVILCSDENTMKEAKKRAEQWLSGIGLELKEEKTRFTHTLNTYEGHLGFDFLGFQVRQHKVGKYHSGKGPTGKRLGFKTLIKPSKEGQKRHLLKMKDIVRQHRGKTQEELIISLNKSNPGWARYYRAIVSKVVYSKLDMCLYTMLAQWAKWRHRNKGRKWRYKRYWHRHGEREVFSTPEGLKLHFHAAAMKIQRHEKVAGTASPYDGRLAYWAKRNYEHPLTKTRMGTILRNQQGKCVWCGHYFRDEDLIEIDHFVPKRLGGKDTLSNLQALHRHCHDRKTALEGKKDLPEPTVFNDNESED